MILRTRHGKEMVVLENKPWRTLGVNNMNKTTSDSKPKGRTSDTHATYVVNSSRERLLELFCDLMLQYALVLDVLHSE